MADIEPRPQFETSTGCTAPGEGASPVEVRHLHRQGIWVLTAAVGSRAVAGRTGARASEAFAQQLLAAPAPHLPQALRQAMSAANRVVHDDEVPSPASLMFATSIVAVVAAPRGLLVSHVGNARCYRFRAGERSLLTPPHTAVSELGGGDERSPFATHHRHLLTRALGISVEVEPDIVDHDARHGDVLMLVNDELSWAVEDESTMDLVNDGAPAGAISSHVVSLGEQAATDGGVIAVAIGSSLTQLSSASN